MNKNIIIAISSLLIISAGAYAVVTLQNNSLEGSREESSTMTGPMRQTNTPTQAEETTQTPSQTNQGVYTEYSEETLASAEGDTYLFFHAPWCPQCVSIENGITEQGVPEGVTILKVDYDTNRDLRQKYGVTLQTTFVKLDANGEKVTNYVAYNEPTFDAVKRDLIN